MCFILINALAEHSRHNSYDRTHREEVKVKVSVRQWKRCFVCTLTTFVTLIAHLYKEFIHATFNATLLTYDKLWVRSPSTADNVLCAIFRLLPRFETHDRQSKSFSFRSSLSIYFFFLRRIQLIYLKLQTSTNVVHSMQNDQFTNSKIRNFHKIKFNFSIHLISVILRNKPVSNGGISVHHSISHYHMI